MDSLKGGAPYLKGRFAQTCGFCGSVFRVEVPGLVGQEQPAEYCCPECGKRFPVKASTTPGVTLISKRTDGRKSHYPRMKNPEPTTMRRGVSKT